MGTVLQPDTLRQRIDDGETALGVLDNTYSPTLVEFYGELGVDFVWIDLEHGGPSSLDGSTLDSLLRAGERSGVELLVRLPGSDPGMVRKALDAGVRSLFLPRVSGSEEVRAAVAASRFEYGGDPGDRGLAAPRASRWGLAEDYVSTEDDETTVGVTIETAASVDAIDDILAVPELGFVFIGPFDLSVSLGHPGEIDHPDVQDAIESVRSAAVEADVPVGGLGFGMDDVNEKAADGYQIINLGSTTAALKTAVQGWLDDFEG